MLRRGENWLPWVPGVIFLIITCKIAQWSVMCEALTRRTGVSHARQVEGCLRESFTYPLLLRTRWRSNHYVDNYHEKS